MKMYNILYIYYIKYNINQYNHVSSINLQLMNFQNITYNIIHEDKQYFIITLCKT